MSVETVRAYLAARGVDPARVLEFDVSSATVALAAQALGCQEARIAKTLAFRIPGEAERILLILAAGDVKLDNAKYKARFGVKARMLSREETALCVGHPVGGVCPFGVREGVEVYLDESLKRFDTVFPAAGSSNSAIELTPEELESLSEALGWVDVCRLPAGE
jgi:prolyl-tRNA editing enzyme YbaK/EbsC (Cys-tRNA(Pro) deacylase)